MKSNDLKNFAIVGGLVLLWQPIKQILGFAGTTAAAGSSLINSLNPLQLNQTNLDNAPRLYAELIKRPALPLISGPNKGKMPLLNRLLSDNDCQRFANFIYDNLNAENYDWDLIYTAFQNANFSVNDLRCIYAYFGMRREWFWERPKNLYDFFRSDLNPEQYAQARRIFYSANIIPNLWFIPQPIG